MEETKQEKISDWREDVSDSASTTLKVLDGETKTAVFLDEGRKISSIDYGTSIVFKVEHEVVDEETNEKSVEEMNFYVKENNFSLLKQFKELGKLTGRVIEISRVGSKKSDTRYTITEVTPK